MSIKAVVICNNKASLLVLFTVFSQVNVDILLKTEGGRVLLWAQIKIFVLVWLGEGRIPALMMELCSCLDALSVGVSQLKKLHACI